MEWRTKKPAGLAASIEAHVSTARLLIFQKAVLYRFRDDIRSLRFDINRRKLLARIEELREHILQFTNQYRYSEEIVDGTMTVEILKIWRRVMLVDALFSEVYEKLSELEQYMATVTANDQTQAISWLQVFFVGGTAGAVTASLLALTGNLVIATLGTIATIVSFGLFTWIWLKWNKAL
jgi:predicted RNA-binding protein with EMAP domain